MDNIFQIIAKFASESGIWAMLFVWLLILLIKSDNKREQTYTTIIAKLVASIRTLELVKEDIEDIKYVLGVGGGNAKKPKKGETNESQTKGKDI